MDSCQCQDCCVLFYVCAWIERGKPAFCFSLMFEISLVLGHQTKLRPVLSLVMSKKDGKEMRCPVDIWHFLFFFFVPYAVLYMLASLCLSAIFNNQAIMMPSWFRQWYLLRSSHQRWNWMTGWLQPGGDVLHFKKKKRTVVQPPHYFTVPWLGCEIVPFLAGLGVFFSIQYLW